MACFHHEASARWTAGRLVSALCGWLDGYRQSSEALTAAPEIMEGEPADAKPARPRFACERMAPGRQLFYANQHGGFTVPDRERSATAAEPHSNMRGSLFAASLPWPRPCNFGRPGLGRLLRVVDRDDNAKEWATPRELLAGDGSDYRREPFATGLVSGARQVGILREALHEFCSISERPNVKARYVRPHRVARSHLLSWRTGLSVQFLPAVNE